MVTGVAAVSVALVSAVVFCSAEESGLISSAVDILTDVLMVLILMVL